MQQLINYYKLLKEIRNKTDPLIVENILISLEIFQVPSGYNLLAKPILNFPIILDKKE
jgi:hypothetical protein